MTAKDFLFGNPRRTRWTVAALCFALGLLFGWLLTDGWANRESGINL